MKAKKQVIGKFYFAPYSELTVADINSAIEEGVEITNDLLDPKYRILFDDAISIGVFNKIPSEKAKLVLMLSTAIETLKFYADGDTWRANYSEETGSVFPPIHDDSNGPGHVPGNRARQTLEDLKGMQ